MQRKLLNIAELSEICSEASYATEHDDLLAALHTHYPDRVFKMVTVRGQWSMEGGLHDDMGNRIADSYFEWLESEYKKAGENAQRVLERFKNSRYIVNKKMGETIYITTPFAEGPEGFLQIEVNAICEVTDRYLFDPFKDKPCCETKNLIDLKYPSMFDTEEVEQVEVIPWQYTFSKLTNVRLFVKEMLSNERSRRLAKHSKLERKKYLVHNYVGRDVSHKPTTQYASLLDFDPNWLGRPMREKRILQDWRDSSAGQSGALFCEHWALELKDRTYQEERLMNFIPLCAYKDGRPKLPKIESCDYDSVYELMWELEKFDRLVGHEFAWYFYMLHGNRIGWLVGSRIAEGIISGHFGLLDNDEKVLLRWYAEQYGF